MISGTPTILIEKGRVLEKEMERLRFNIDDLMEELRTNGYANIMDIEYAIIETNGLLSVIPKSNKRPVTPSDLDMNIKYEGMPFLLVSDGVVNERALQGASISMEWLHEKLQNFGVTDIKDVFIASLDTSGSLFVQTKTKKKSDE